MSEGGYYFPDITGPEAPEEYPMRLNVGSEQVARQVSDQLIVVEYIEGGITAVSINAEQAHDAVGAAVPTTVTLGEGDIVTLTVHYRAGNPAAGGAPFAYPITEGTGWEGGYRTIQVSMAEPERQVTEGNPPTPTEPPPVPTCKVPSLRGDSLRGAKNRLRAAHCGIGAVHLAAGATAGKGKVVKQFHAAGTELAAGAPVAVKLSGIRG
jgi:PASTA domain